MTDEKNLEGIGGWLILVAIGIVFTPLRLVFFMVVTYSPIFSTGAWEALTTEGSELYHPLWSPVILGELLLNSSMLLAWIYMTYLFFSKKATFPKWYIGLGFFSLTFVIADAYAVKQILYDEPMFDQETVKELLRSLVMVVIWVPYMLVSKRVKATFVRE